MASHRIASCSCGQLQARVSGEPLRVSVCHCLACQRRTGSTYGAQARFRAADVQVTGQSTEYARRADDDGEVRRYSFCPRCGATVFYFCGDEDDPIAIPTGAFADPEFPAPRHSVWETRRHPWVSMPADTETRDR